MQRWTSGNHIILDLYTWGSARLAARCHDFLLFLIQKYACQPTIPNIVEIRNVQKHKPDQDLWASSLTCFDILLTHWLKCSTEQRHLSSFKLPLLDLPRQTTPGAEISIKPQAPLGTLIFLLISAAMEYPRPGQGAIQLTSRKTIWKELRKGWIWGVSQNRCPPKWMVYDLKWLKQNDLGVPPF